MSGKILVGHDLFQGGHDALALGHLIARATGAELVVGCIVAPGDTNPPNTRIQQVAETAGAQPVVLVADSPARGLEALAAAIGAELIVLGSSRDAKLGELVAGSAARSLFLSAPCAVAVVPRAYRSLDDQSLSKIVVGVDGSLEAGIALEAEIGLARSTGAALKLIAVAEPPVALGALAGTVEERRRAALRDAVGRVPPGVAVEATLVTGDPGTKLRDASTGGSLLALGSCGDGPVRRVTLGSVTSALAGGAACPLVVYRRQEIALSDRAPLAAAAG